MKYFWLCLVCGFRSGYNTNFNTILSGDTGELICKRCDETMKSIPMVDSEKKEYRDIKLKNKNKK